VTKKEGRPWPGASLRDFAPRIRRGQGGIRNFHASRRKPPFDARSFSQPGHLPCVLPDSRTAALQFAGKQGSAAPRA
jgi:hypothetical protein